MIAQKPGILANLTSTFYKKVLLVAKRRSHNHNIQPHNTTQHSTTIKMSYHPTSQQLCPLSPWVGQWRPQILAPRLPMVPLQVPGTRFAHGMAGSLVWDKLLSHIEKYIDRGGVGYRWPTFQKYIQQSNGNWHTG
jgi:hypothetical protein